MKANPVAWKIFGVSITLVRGRCLAALVLMADAAFVWTGYWENGGMSESVRLHVHVLPTLCVLV